LIGVNHLEGHINSVFLEPDPPPFPFVALLASGGHTNIYHVTSHTNYEIMGQTRDDSAGEAFDKVAKMLGLGYPGGKIIEKLSEKGSSDAIVFPRAYLDKSAFDFSFSGIKTSVNHYIHAHKNEYEKLGPNIAASFQEAVVDVLSYKIIHAAVNKGCNHLSIVGGVAANSRLRQRVEKEATEKGLFVHIPSIDLCGDNAAMIAAVGYHYYLIKKKVMCLDDDVFSREKIIVSKQPTTNQE